ncbi:hypothetical protein CCACVL1_01025, partial [Corchorus capsularis]
KINYPYKVTLQLVNPTRGDT